MKYKIKIIKAAIKIIEKDCGKMCKEYTPYCPNCQSNILLGHLNDFLETITYSPYE